MGPRLVPSDAYGGPGGHGSVYDVIDGGLLPGGTEVLGKNDAGLGKELSSPGCAGPG
jgi:hypothetical protein